MKLLLLADASNPHNRKWINYLAKEGIELEVISLIDAYFEGVKVHKLRSSAYAKRRNNVQYNRIKVLRNIYPQIKRIIKRVKPDILHCHYASSFGLFGALTKFHPLIVSVWGSDITDFPYKNVINHSIIKFVLRKADKICVSSQYLAAETAKFTNKKTDLVYFGTDTEQFKSLQDITLKKKITAKRPFVFGTIKGLYPHYGIKYLIEAAAIFDKEVDKENWELWIGGDGNCKEDLVRLTKNLDLTEKVKFLGKLPHKELPHILNRMDVFVVPSLRESFGVIAVEASACSLPLIVSDTGGLPETVIDNKTGYYVRPADPDALANKLTALYNNKPLRKAMGDAGREYVLQNFSWEHTAPKMIDVYKSVLKKDAYRSED